MKMNKRYKKLRVLSLVFTMTLGALGTLSLTNSTLTHAASIETVNVNDKSNSDTQESQDASSGRHLRPKQVAAAFYASYNGDLAAGFERYISKNLVLHGFDGPNDREVWLAGDLELKASLTGYRLGGLHQIAEGTMG